MKGGARTKPCTTAIYGLEKAGDARAYLDSSVKRKNETEVQPVV